MNDNPIRKTIPALACALVMAAWCGPARAQGKAKDLARDTVDQVLRQPAKVRDGDLDAWSRSVIEARWNARAKTPPGPPAPSRPNVMPAALPAAFPSVPMAPRSSSS